MKNPFTYNTYKKTLEGNIFMKLTVYELKRTRKFFINLCNDLILKEEEETKRQHYHRLIEEVNNYANFPIMENLADLVLSNWNRLDEERIKACLCTMANIQGETDF